MKVRLWCKESDGGTEFLVVVALTLSCSDQFRMMLFKCGFIYGLPPLMTFGIIFDSCNPGLMEVKPLSLMKVRLWCKEMDGGTEF